MHNVSRCLALVSVLVISSSATAQNVITSAPFQSTSDSYFEAVGTGFNFDNGSFRFSWNPTVVPPFGGFDPNGGARLAFNAGPLSFSIFGAQGNRRSSVMQTPMLTVPNGGSGFFIDTELRPFVVGFEPVVGGQPFAVSQPFAPPPIVGTPPVLQGPSIQDRWAAAQSSPQRSAEPIRRRVEPARRSVSSAEFGDISVAEIRRQKATERQDAAGVVDGLIEKANAALEQGKTKTAKNHLRNALRQADGEQRSSIEAILNRLP